MNSKACPFSNFFNPKTLADPFEYYDAALRSTPVIYDESADSFVVFSHTLIKQVLNNPSDFSSDIQFILSGERAEEPDVKAILDQGWEPVNTLISADPPLHTRFRKLVNLAFSKPKVEKMEASIRTLSCTLIDRWIGKGKLEFVNEFAVPLPVHVITRQLGLESNRADDVKRWTDASVDRLGGVLDKEREIECAKQVVECQHVLKEKMDESRDDPRDDILSNLVHARIDGLNPLSDSEILSIALQFLVAGNETTTSTLSEAMVVLSRRSDLFAQLKEDATLIPNFIDEVLRLASPVSGIWRIANSKVSLGGITIPKGAKVMLRCASANRDPNVFEDPNEFVLSRKNVQQHVSFGGGPHICIGKMLSRKEMIIAIEELLGRMTSLSIENDAKLVYMPNAMLRGVQSLPLVFSC